ncbi:YybH family protein [Telluria aromaticivorans]|uniref:Nuclear transport factor 2 family protein n=1 Tax=Telluria aromaticivorans TaxID=2725995 RepID=A0A7Y2JV49_9BURK|nr:nuclear transport factor 2 family protein [Telluria aromaticivorans]NNG21570.1 nuclear transport factor 2 family protein [Telluria aromaticivorans]
MKKKSVPGLFLAAALFAVSSTGLAASPKEALATFHDALTSGDKTKALSLLAPDIAIYESGYVERSRDEYAHHHLGGDMEFAKTSTRKVLKQTERIDGNTAVVWEETETTGTSKGKPLHVLGTGTAVLERKGDTWAIVHVHWSSRKAK